MLTKLGKYQIETELGRGAMGVVYRAQDTRLERPVALKVMAERLAHDPQLVMRFYREARSAGKLRHPNVVTIYEIDEADGTPFIAMEFIEGLTLGQIISTRKDLAVLTKLNLIIQACKGLNYAHRRGTVHRDVKPSNIMVQSSTRSSRYDLPDDSVKIVDFGIARVAAGTSITRADAILGTPVYMSPEQTRDRDVDARSDIFSLGIILYELLTYQKPFFSSDLRTLFYKIQNEEPASLVKLLPDGPPQLERLDKIVLKALAKNREERYQTAEELAFALQQVSDFFKHDMVELYVKESQRALEAGNLTDARESLQKALEIDSNDDVAKNLFEEVQEQIYTRLRSEKIERSLRQADQALETAQYDDAISLLAEILQLSPGHELALQRKRVAVERRERALKITQHTERAEKLVASRDWRGARAQLEAVLALEPKHSIALQMLAEVAVQERQQLVLQYTQEGRTFLAQKNFDQALQCLEKALTLDPVNIEVETLLRQVHSRKEQEARRRRLEERIAAIQGALNAETFDEALGLAIQALQEFPDDPRMLKLYSQASRLTEERKKRKCVEEQLQIARSFLQNNQYGEAIAALQKGLETVPDDPRLASFLKTVQQVEKRAAVETLCREAIRDANAQIRQKNFSLAIETLEQACASAGESAELRELLQLAHEQQAEYQREERIAQALGQALTFQVDDNYEGAISILERARDEIKATEIDRELAVLRQQHQKFEQRREDTVERARQLLQAGGSDRAAALLDAAPRAYSRDEKFKRLHAEAREALRLTEEIHAAVKRINELTSSKNLVEAETLLQQALKTYPGDPTLLAAQNRLLQQQLRLRRTQWSRMVVDGWREFQHENLTAAYDIASEVLRQDPQNREAISLLETVQREQQQREDEKQQQVGINQARAQLSEGAVDEAIATLARLLVMHPESTSVAMALKQARAQKSETDRRQRFRSKMLRANGLLGQKRFSDAVSLLEQLRHEFPQEAELLKLLSYAQQQVAAQERTQVIEKISAEAQRFLRAKDFAQALQSLEQGLKAYPGEKGLQGLLQSATAAEAAQERYQAVSEVARRCEELSRANRFAEAIELLEKSLNKYKAEPTLLNLRTQLERGWEQNRRAEAIRAFTLRARESITGGRLEEAVRMLEGASSQFSGEAELALLLKQAREALRAQERRQAIEKISAEAQLLLKAKDFAQALQSLEQGLKAYTGEETLRSLLQSVMAAKAAQERDQGVSEVARRCEELSRANRFAEGIELVEQSLGQFKGDQALLKLKKQLESGDRKARQRSLKELRKISGDISHVSDPEQLEALSEQTSILGGRYQTDPKISSTVAQVRRVLAARMLEVKPQVLVADIESVSASPVPAAPEAGYELGIQAVPLPETPSTVEVIPGPRLEGIRQRRSHFLLFPAIAGVAVVAGGLILARLLRKGSVDIRTVPEGAHVRINQQECITPNCRFKLPAGNYRLEASMPGYQTKVTSFSVDTTKSASSISLTLEPLTPPVVPTYGTLVVETREDDVDVFLNDQKYDGKTSHGMLRIQLAENEYVVRVEKNGYQIPSSQRVRLVKNEEARVTFKLTRLSQLSSLVIHGAILGARVTLDDSPAPLGIVAPDGSFSSSVNPGEHVIKLSKDGYLSKSLHRQFIAGKTVNLESEDVQQDVKSEPVPSSPKVAPPRIGSLDPIEELRAAIDQQPKDPAGYINLGLKLREKGDLDGAIAQFREALHLQPESAKAHTGLGMALYSRHDLDGAIAEYRKALSLEPSLVIARYNLALALDVKGDVDGAIVGFREVVRIQPGDADAHYALARAYNEKGDLERAVAEYQKTADLQPKNAVAHESLGHALLQKGDRQPALEQFRTASQLDPTNPTYRNEYQNLEKDLNH